MFDLSTSPLNPVDESLPILYGAYLNNEGILQSFEFEVDAHVETNVDQKALWTYVIEKYSNRLIDFRGYSRYNKLNHMEVDCNQFKVKTDEPIIKTRETFSPCYGTDIVGCLQFSLQHEICQAIFDSGNGANAASVKLIPVIQPPSGLKLNLIVFGDNGFEIIRGHLYHEFYEDRNSSCATCIEGYNRYVEAVNKINSFLIANTNNAVFSGNYIHDFKINTDKDISDTIYETFYTIMELAKIKTIRFERTK